MESSSGVCEAQTRMRREARRADARRAEGAAGARARSARRARGGAARAASEVAAGRERDGGKAPRSGARREGWRGRLGTASLSRFPGEGITPNDAGAWRSRNARGIRARGGEPTSRTEGETHVGRSRRTCRLRACGGRDARDVRSRVFEFGVKKSDSRISFSADTGAVTNDKPGSAYFARYFFPARSRSTFSKAKRTASARCESGSKTNDVLRFACSACRTSDRTQLA